MNQTIISPSKLAASYRQRILDSCQAGKSNDEQFRNALFKNLDLKAQTGQLIRAARSDLNKTDFQYATDFLQPKAIKQYEAIADFIANQENRSLESALREIQQALTVSGSLQASNGLGQQQLHEPNFHSQAVRLRQSLVGLFSHYLQRRPIKIWANEEIHDLLCSFKPLSQICAQLEDELSARGIHYDDVRTV